MLSTLVICLIVAIGVLVIVTAYYEHRLDDMIQELTDARDKVTKLEKELSADTSHYKVDHYYVKPVDFKTIISVPCEYSRARVITEMLIKLERELREDSCALIKITPGFDYKHGYTTYACHIRLLPFIDE